MQPCSPPAQKMDARRAQTCHARSWETLKTFNFQGSFQRFSRDGFEGNGPPVFQSTWQLKRWGRRNVAHQTPTSIAALSLGCDVNPIDGMEGEALTRKIDSFGQKWDRWLFTHPSLPSRCGGFDRALHFNRPTESILVQFVPILLFSYIRYESCSCTVFSASASPKLLEYFWLNSSSPAEIFHLKLCITILSNLINWKLRGLLNNS